MKPTAPSPTHPKRYTPRRNKKQHLTAVRVAQEAGVDYTWLWLDGGITHCVAKK